jgi:hypothetical protein
MTSRSSSSTEGLNKPNKTSDNAFSQFPCKHPRTDESAFTPGSLDYKKARKRRQNRESANRIRARKKEEESLIVSTLDTLRESTSRLQIENSQIQSENEVLRKQISYYKRLAGRDDFGDLDLSSELLEEEGGRKKGGRGKNVAGVALTILLLSIFAVVRIEDSGKTNTGGRSLAFVEEATSLKPVVFTVIAVVCGLLVKILLGKLG